MKRTLPSLALVALLVPLGGALEPAEASGGWFAGADFSVGGVHFTLGFADFDRHRFAPGHYYRTDRRLGYRGYECGSACFVRDDVYYHHAECPVTLRHFHHNGFDPYPVWRALPYGVGHYYPYSYPYSYRSHHRSHYRSHHGSHYRPPYRPWHGDHRTEPPGHHRYDDHRERDRKRYDRDDDSDRRRRRGRRFETDDRFDSDRRAARSRSRGRRDDD